MHFSESVVRDVVELLCVKRHKSPLSRLRAEHPTEARPLPPPLTPDFNVENDDFGNRAAIFLPRNWKSESKSPLSNKNNIEIWGEGEGT